MLDTHLLQLSVLFAIALSAIYVYFRAAFSYWQQRGVPTLKPKPPFGDLSDTIFRGKNVQQAVTAFYKEFDGHKFGGIYNFASPSLLLRDPEIIKVVLLQDFDKFHSRGIPVNEEKDPLLGHLVALSGSKWRNLRVKLTPTFTSGKMKMMFGTLVDCGRELQVCLEPLAHKRETIEIKDVLARYSTDVIASCAFGIQCNCLKNPDAEFRQWGRKIFEPNLKRRLARVVRVAIPSLALRLRLDSPPNDISNYFMNMVKNTVEYRETNGVKRNDFMDLMIKLKNKTLEEPEGEDITFRNLDIDDLKTNAPFEVTMNVIAAQAFVFFLAGFETSSTTMTFCLYELALNPDIQDRLRAEIDTVLEKHEGNITYESVFEMKYLEKVVDETLRKYPPATVLTRECAKSTKLRGTDLTVEKGTKVLIPVLALHQDPKYYPDPERFDPERFSEEEKKKRPKFSYLPFGEGPRICIGMRFGLMQTKVGLISILSKFEVQCSEKTSVPLKFDSGSVVLAPRGGMWLKVVKRCGK